MKYRVRIGSSLHIALYGLLLANSRYLSIYGIGVVFLPPLKCTHTFLHWGGRCLL